MLRLVYYLFILSLSFLFIKNNLQELNDFKKSCKDILKNGINLSLEEILEKLNKLINKYNKNHKFNNKLLNFMRHYIRKIC